MLSVDLAHRLLSAGLVWEPEPGDRFVVPGRGMDEEVFVVSHMVVDVHEFATGRVIGFNGTTEWALDSLDLVDTLWLPSETQLREVLADRFVALERADDGWVVVLVGGATFLHPDAECAYALAVLSILDFT